MWWLFGLVCSTVTCFVLVCLGAKGVGKTYRQRRWLLWKILYRKSDRYFVSFFYLVLFFGF